MKVQQDLMRHASIQTTMNVYGQAMLQSKREANREVYPIGTVVVSRFRLTTNGTNDETCATRCQDRDRLFPRPRAGTPFGYVPGSTAFPFWGCRRRKVRRFLEADRDVVEIAEAGSGAEAVSAIGAFRPDLVFLDVQLPDMDGFAVLEASTKSHDFHVVFLTAHDEHALRAFEAEALDYLMKPVDPQRFERALERAKHQIQLRRRTPRRESPYLKRILVEKNRREKFLLVDQLDWAESDRNYVSLHTHGEVYTIRGTIETLSRSLDPSQFVRTSRSALINLDHIKEMQPWFHGERRVLLKDGTELLWTRRFRAQPSLE
jgi:two-component system LytT family response regulator